MVRDENVEYSSMGFALFFLGEYANMILTLSMKMVRDENGPPRKKMVRKTSVRFGIRKLKKKIVNQAYDLFFRAVEHFIFAQTVDTNFY
jgi:hypothetical protein